jgi:hypothetical protein
MALHAKKLCLRLKYGYEQDQGSASNAVEQAAQDYMKQFRYQGQMNHIYSES